MILTHILSFVIFPIIVLWKITFEDRDDILDRQDTNVLKGIAAMCIVFAHFYNALLIEDIGIGKLWLYTGGIGVCIFFFLSGYGLNISKSYEKSDFMIRRIKGVMIPFIIMRIPYFFVYYPLGTKSVGYFFGYLLGIFEPQWFVSVIIIIYIGYYICYRSFGKRWLNISVCIYNIILGILFYVLNMNERWYNAHLLFSIGMLVADYNADIVKWLKKRNWWLVNLSLGTVFLFSSVIFTLNKGNLVSIMFKIIAGIGISMLFYNLLLKIRLNSRILQWIGKNSLLVYIIHLQFLAMQDRIAIIPISLFTLSGVVITFLYIVVYNICEKKIVEWNRGKKTK